MCEQKNKNYPALEKPLPSLWYRLAGYFEVSVIMLKSMYNVGSAERHWVLSSSPPPPPPDSGIFICPYDPSFRKT